MYFQNELLKCEHVTSRQTSKNEKKALLSDIFLQHCWVCFKEKVNRPFARSSHTVQNYIYW